MRSGWKVTGPPKEGERAAKQRLKLLKLQKVVAKLVVAKAKQRPKPRHRQKQKAKAAAAAKAETKENVHASSSLKVRAGREPTARISTKMIHNR